MPAPPPPSSVEPPAPALQTAVETLRLKRPPSRILLLRPSALGDVGRTVPALVSLKRAFPEAEIDWLVNRPFAPAIDSHPDLAEAIPFDRNRPGSVPALLRRLRASRYDLAIDFQGLARTGGLMAASGARVRVTDRAAREGAWLAGNRRLRIPPHRHAVDRLLSLVEACGIHPVADLQLYVSSDDRAAAGSFRHAAALLKSDPGNRFLAIAPTARWGCKRWPLDRFASIATAIAAEGVSVLALFGPADREPKAAFEAAVRGAGDSASTPGAPILACTPPSVGVLMAHLEAACGLLGNDSASLHLAVGLGTPTVSLFGPTDPAEVGPFLGGRPAAEHVVVQAPDAPEASAYRQLGDDDRYMRSIEVAAVRAAVDRMLAGAAGGDGDDHAAAPRHPGAASEGSQQVFEPHSTHARGSEPGSDSISPDTNSPIVA